MPTKKEEIKVDDAAPEAVESAPEAVESAPEAAEPKEAAPAAPKKSATRKRASTKKASSTKKVEKVVEQPVAEEETKPAPAKQERPRLGRQGNRHRG